MQQPVNNYHRARAKSFSLGISFAALVLLLAGCGFTASDSKPSLEQFSFQRAHVISALAKDGGVSPLPEAIVARAQFIAGEVCERLLYDSKGWSAAVDIVETSEVLAFSYGSGSGDASGGIRGIILSITFLRQLGTEAELAFVLAHELAHGMLGHSEESGGYTLEQELAADRRALALLATASYDIRLAPRALAFSKSHTLRGDISARQQALQSSIISSNWTPPGTISRRSFRELQVLLAHS